jgi:hypothetical protein
LKVLGGLTIVTPNLKSAQHKKFQKNWLHLDPPRHICLYSEKSLSQILSLVGFHNSQVFTSNARVGSSIKASVSIEKNGNYQLGSLLDYSDEVRVKLLQLKVFAKDLINPKIIVDGDELIAISQKP